MKVIFTKTRTSVWLWGLILLWAGLPLGEHRAPQRPATAIAVPAGNDFSLSVDVQQDNALITWNPNAPAIAAAAAGMLSIRDGRFDSETRLGSSELHRGSMVYGPIASSATTFQLRIGAATETFSVVNFEGHSHAKPSSTISVKKEKSPTHRIGIAASATGGDERLNLVRPRVFNVPNFAPIQRAWAPSGSFPPARTPVSPEELPPVPDLGAAGDSAAAGPAQVPFSTGVVRVPAPPPDEHLSPPEQIEYVAARPLKHVRPTAPASILRLVPSKVTIRVKVYINVEGKVIRAESLSRGGTLIDYLANLAVNAAQEWQFLPAHRGDKAVESETVLQFDFERNGSAGGSS